MAHIAESLLECRYFDLPRIHFREILGAERFRILKPTQRREKWLGFDQGWFAAEQVGEELETSIRSFIQDQKAPDEPIYRAVFLQYKVVEHRRTRRGAPDGWSAPWYCSHLSLDADPDTGISQHETLFRLSKLPEAEVAYACPMIFSHDEVVDDPKIEELRFVDIKSAQEGWLTSGGHKIAFQSKDGAPFWCSEPIEAREWIPSHRLHEAKRMNTEQILGFLERAESVIWHRHERSFDLNPIPFSLYIVESDK